MTLTIISPWLGLGAFVTLCIEVFWWLLWDAANFRESQEAEQCEYQEKIKIYHETGIWKED